jgi:predicted RNA-binding protein Jag
MALNAQITPNLSSKAAVHVAVAIGDVADDAAAFVLTITLTETNFGLPYGVPQIFKATVEAGVLVVRNSKGDPVVWTVGKEPNANVAGRLGNALSAIQSIAQAIVDAPAGTLYVGPRP